MNDSMKAAHSKYLIGFLLVVFAIIPIEIRAAAEQNIENNQEELTVGTRVVPPFVIDEGNGEYSGISIYLWEHIGSELGLEFSYQENDIQGMLDGVSDGNYFAAVSALT